MLICYPLSEVKNTKVFLEMSKFSTDVRIWPIDSSISANASPNLPLFVWKDHLAPGVIQDHVFSYQMFLALLILKTL